MGKMAAEIPAEIVAFVEKNGFPKEHPGELRWTGKWQRAKCLRCGEEDVNGPCSQEPGMFFATVLDFNDDGASDGEDIEQKQFIDITGLEAFDRHCSGFCRIMTPVGTFISADGKHPVGMMLAGDALYFLDSMDKRVIAGAPKCTICFEDATTFVVDRDEPESADMWYWFCDDHLDEINEEDDVVPIVHWAV